MLTFAFGAEGVSVSIVWLQRVYEQVPRAVMEANRNHIHLVVPCKIEVENYALAAERSVNNDVERESAKPGCEDILATWNVFDR